VRRRAVDAVAIARIGAQTSGPQNDRLPGCGGVGVGEQRSGDGIGRDSLVSVIRVDSDRAGDNFNRSRGAGLAAICDRKGSGSTGVDAGRTAASCLGLV